MYKLAKIIISIFVSLLTCILCGLELKSSAAVISCTVGMTLLSSFVLDDIKNKVSLGILDYIIYLFRLAIIILLTLSLKLGSISLLIVTLCSLVAYIILELVNNHYFNKE